MTFLVGLVFLCTLSSSAQSENFPETNSVLLMVTGLAGDLESETLFHQQLGGWLQWLEAMAPRPQKVYVLTDRPESVASSPVLSLTILPATRNQFADLSRTFSGQTNPVIAIVWGHGGSQGGTPVFHLRGPRLTASDFVEFANGMPAARQHWILLFRGSGRFARELIGRGRDILSSDHGVMFESDPVSMDVLLRQLRSIPGARSFAKIAEELGQGVAGWYDERNLARTEEPTLWRADQPPWLLSSPKHGSSPLLENPAGSQIPTPAPAAARAPNDQPPAGSGLPPLWKSIARVKPEEYPEADAIVLRQTINFAIAQAPAIKAERDEFIQVLTLEGKHYGDFDIQISPGEEVNFDDCEVLRADGTLLRLDPGAIREEREAPVGDYPAPRRKFFSLPGIGPGAILHVHYRTEWKKFPLPHVSIEIPVGSQLPVRDLTLTVRVPRESAFHFKWEGMAVADPALSQTAYGSSYRWDVEKLPPVVRETLAPPAFQPRLLISTFPDWPSFSEWYERIVRLADAITPEVAAKAAELTHGAKSDREKVNAIYRYVAGLRYVMVPLGINSHRPHAAANVLRNGFGDCKDKANLFNTLLRSAKIDASLVLAPRFTQAHDALPGLAFNHAISRVVLGNETFWVDTTDDLCRFGMLPPGDSGRSVLVIDGTSRSLTSLPMPQPKDHQLDIRAELDLTRGTDVVPALLKAKASGYPEYLLRLLARETKVQHRNLPLLAAKFRPAAGVFALENQRWTPVSEFEEAFSWEANGTFAGTVSASGRRWLVRAPFWIAGEWDLALCKRSTPLFLGQGFPVQLEESIDLALPPGAEQVSLPVMSECNQGLLQWRLEWTRSSNRSLRAGLRVILAHGELQPEDTLPFQEQYRQLLAACAAAASFDVP